MTELYANVMDVEVRDALKHYVLGGAMGHILDCERDSLRHVSQRGKVRLTIFETEQLLQKNAQGIIPVLLYLFRCIERMLDGSPTLIPLDEAWAYLQHPLFKDRLKDWLKTLRKKNAAVILATQQISDLTSSGIEDVIFESCPTKVLPPNTECRNPTSRSFYERAGLNGRELDQLAMAIPKKHYYMVSPLGRRMVDLGIGPVALAFVGVNGKEERMAAQAVMDEYPDTWRSEWLKVKGQHDWAEYYEREEHKCGLSLVG